VREKREKGERLEIREGGEGEGKERLGMREGEMRG